MPEIHHGVIETSTGDLLRCGFTDFASTLQAGESQRTDTPFPAKIKHRRGEANMHRWNGASWTQVAQPALPTVPVANFILPVLPRAGDYNAPDTAYETSATPVVKARVLLDFGAMNISGQTLQGYLYTDGWCESGVNGEVRVYNESDAVSLGTISYTESAATVKLVQLANLPATGVKKITVEIKRTAGSGSNKFAVGTATISFSRVV